MQRRTLIVGGWGVTTINNNKGDVTIITGKQYKYIKLVRKKKFSDLEILESRGENVCVLSVRALVMYECSCGNRLTSKYLICI